MTIIISYQNTLLDLPYAPGEELDGDGALPQPRADSADLSTMRPDPELPSFEEVLCEQRSLTLDFNPVVTVKYTRSVRVKRMTTTLVRHVIGPGMTQTDETVAQWDLFSGRVRPLGACTPDLTSPVTMDTSTQKHQLQCTLPVGIPETASHKSSRLWYTLDTQISSHKTMLSSCGLTEFSEEIVVARIRQSDDLSRLPISVSATWLNKLRFTMSYPQKHIALHEDTEIPVKITVSLFEKPIRLNSVNFAVIQTCNANTRDTQRTGLLKVYSNRFVDSDLAEHDEIELNEAREQGFDVRENFLDSVHKGNLLIPGAEETVLDYTLKLNARVIEALSASTSYTHPFHVTHRMFTSLRFSQLDLTDKPNQKSRRYVDLAVSIPVVFSRARTVFDMRDSSIAAPFDYDDFLLCEYPRLKDTVFANDFADDSAPAYEPLAPPDYEAATNSEHLSIPGGIVRRKCRWYRR